MSVSPQKEFPSRAPWHTWSVQESLQKLGSTPQGLTSEDAQKRLQAEGPNELTELAGSGFGKLLWEQASSTMIVILIVAGLLSLFLKGGEGVPVDAIAIFSIVVLFVVLGTWQEFRAQKAIAALKKMSMPLVRVVRDGQTISVSSRDLVAGDVVSLEAGQTVPADGRMISVQSLRVQESALTGESEPIEKGTEPLAQVSAPLGDRKNRVYMGSAVTFGRGLALVTETGNKTELGRIATLLQTVEKNKTPLQKKLDGLGKALALLAVAVAVGVALIGVLLEGKSVADVTILAISIAVAVVPEGLPAVLTFALALGSQKMLKRKALVRKLPAVETLGSVTTICSDKTGTLTQNHMTVTHLAAGCASVHETLSAQVECLVLPFALCNDVDGRVGDPTEVALVQFLEKSNTQVQALRQAHPRVQEYPFDSDRKRMTTVHTVNTQGTDNALWAALVKPGSFLSLTKGAFEQVVEGCDSVSLQGSVVPLEDGVKAKLREQVEAWAAQGKRVLGFAARSLSAEELQGPQAQWETRLTFVGLCAMIDPPRPEAREAVQVCQKAGIRVVMITGDHPATAKAIAHDLGICDASEKPVTGLQLQACSEQDLLSTVVNTRVFARVSPEQKLRIVEALQAKGHVVAMTGDGVNDAPALRKADIGVAMGTGTDVAKEAADIVLLDDNFATIVAAVEEGRIVYDNLRRFVMFSLSGNVAKVLLVAVSPLVGLKAMLTPIQILYSNLLTDGLMGLGMGMEKAEPNTMSRPPFPPGESIFARGVGLHVALVGPMIAAVLLGMGHALWPESRSPESLLYWGTTMFTMLAFTQLARAFSARSFQSSVLTTGLKGNPFLFGMVALALGLQLVAVFVPGLHPFFETAQLSLESLGLCAGVALGLLLAMELVKVAQTKVEQTQTKERTPL